MAERRYEYRLWRDRPGTVLGRVLSPKLVIGDTTDWFDLDDRAATMSRLAEMIARSGDGNGDRTGYWLELLDPATRERVTKVEAGESGLGAGANGVGSSLSLEDVSDEVLIRELARRLRAR